MGLVEARRLVRELRDCAANHPLDLPMVEILDRLEDALAPAKRQFKDILDEEVDTVIREWGDLHMRQFGRKPDFGTAVRKIRKLVSELGVPEILDRIDVSYREKRPQWAWANGCVPTPTRILAEFDSLARPQKAAGW